MSDEDDRAVEQRAAAPVRPALPSSPELEPDDIRLPLMPASARVKPISKRKALRVALIAIETVIVLVAVAIIVVTIRNAHDPHNASGPREFSDVRAGMCTEIDYYTDDDGNIELHNAFEAVKCSTFHDAEVLATDDFSKKVDASNACLTRAQNRVNKDTEHIWDTGDYEIKLLRESDGGPALCVMVFPGYSTGPA